MPFFARAIQFLDLTRRHSRECLRQQRPATGNGGLLLGARASRYTPALGARLRAGETGARSGAARPAAVASAAGALPVLGFVDFEGAAAEVGAVQRLHGARCIGVRHFHETEAARTTRITIGDQSNFLDDSVSREQGAHGLFGRREGEISNV